MNSDQNSNYDFFHLRNLIQAEPSIAREIIAEMVSLGQITQLQGESLIEFIAGIQ